MTTTRRSVGLAVIAALSAAAVFAMPLVDAAFAAGKGNKTPSPTPSGIKPVPLAASSWQFEYSLNMPSGPTANGSTGWYFDFPPYDLDPSTCDVTLTCPSVHYLVTSYSADISAASSLSMTITVQLFTTGGPFSFQYMTNTNNTCVSPARVRAFIERQKDQGGEYYRYWSNPISYQLDSNAGTVTLTTPLTPDQWSDVNGLFGTANPAAFTAALQNVGKIGMTFGGGCFFGHSVWVSGGDARFTLTNYVINP
jgi:hypothetical protein